MNKVIYIPEENLININDLIKENQELKERINDAIEYIKYCQTSEKDIFPVIEAKKMIEILKGSDVK